MPGIISYTSTQTIIDKLSNLLLLNPTRHVTLMNTDKNSMITGRKQYTVECTILCNIIIIMR